MSNIKNSKKNCLFCQIVKMEQSSKCIYEDEYVLCIKDIKPVSTHHYLILPKNHIANVKALKKKNEELYDKMVAAIDIIVHQFNLNENSIITGFHWPPFTTINHLHLHIISPIENMSLFQRLIFRVDSYWFVSTDYVKSYLKKNSYNEHLNRK